MEKEESKVFETEIGTEFRASYFQLMEQRLHIELWDKERVWLNKFLGYASIPLINIVEGNFRQIIFIQEPVPDGKAYKQMAIITFDIYFEEIWDFYLTFMDWKATNLQKEDDKSLVLNPSVQLTLKSDQALENVS